MRKKVVYDKKYLAEVLNYSQVPVRQILSINIKPFEQLLLIQLFSHTENWGVSFNQISNSFYKKKNRNDIKQCFESLIANGYLQETDNTYYIILTKIQSDYESFLKRGDNSVSIVKNTNIDSSATSLNDSSTISGVIVPLSGDDSSATSKIDSYATTNNIKIILKEKNELNTSKRNDNEDFEKNILTSNNIEDLKILDTDIPNKIAQCSNEEFSIGNSDKVEIAEAIETNFNPSLSTTSNFHYSPIDIQYQIEAYLLSDSKYFKGISQNLVSDSFTAYYNQYPNSKLTITKYEQVLFFHLLQLTMSISTNDLNSYLDTHPIYVNPADTKNIVRMINNDLTVQEIFKKIIEDVNTIHNDNY